MKDIPIELQRLWPAMMGKALSYEEQMQAVIKKVLELEERVKALEDKEDSN